MKSYLLIGVFICLGCSISGCGYSSSGSNYNGMQNTLTLTGNWQFTYTSSKGGASTVTGTITQNGSSFSANVTITSSCATSATFSGTLSGYALTGTLTATNLETISVMGTVATDYNSASGTYQVMSVMGGCAAASGDSGTWTAKRVGSGIYGGMLVSAT